MMPDLPNVGLERDIAQFIVSEIEHNNLMFCFYIRIFSYSFGTKLFASFVILGVL